MTEKTDENSPKDEDDTTNMDVIKCTKVFFIVTQVGQSQKKICKIYQTHKQKDVFFVFKNDFDYLCWQITNYLKI